MTDLSLSPSSLVNIPAGNRLVLPSPNGSKLSLATGGVPTLAGCLRNPFAVANRAGQRSPEAALAAAGFRNYEQNLLETLLTCGRVKNWSIADIGRMLRLPARST